MASYFQNPSNGYIVKGNGKFAILWAVLFGPFYFAYKGLWLHALLSAVAAVLTMGFGALIYGFFGPGLVNRHYQHRGWLTRN
jgi:hypothetical protein